ncbi:glycoside hydrolase family 10 protein [Labilibacter marinus]|uniref:glycoside hydrolase family 10 protein n=1 Tax=Labilibacter marinus TaxID=1477105 RepID=UPI00095004EB|nr:family 10 glycosylhydrolase [Labilibacter marinus]
MRFIIITVFLSCVLSIQGEKKTYPKREMRAMWIATVANIDWPSKPGLAVDMQKNEMVELLDVAKDYNLNTIVFQIRPASDAFFQSELEPWSQWLTGEQGLAPEPDYDPLQFTIDECRKRGLDVHVWLNPYRAVFDTVRCSVADDHPIKTNPEWFVTYGSTAYFNPGLPETRNHVSSVVADIIRRYSVDAIHFDDYFYPYKIAGREFPDQEAFEEHSRGFLPEEKDDWRRDNVDLIIQQLHDSIKAINPSVEFGISPFGVWRNKSKDPQGSATKAGVTNYDDLYADILKWQKAGWIDYVTPQIYWHIGKTVADFKIISEWWNDNAYDCPVYTGHGLYRLNETAKAEQWRSSEEISRQVALGRELPSIAGSMFYSAKWLKKNPLGLKDNLKEELYFHSALPPVNHRVKPMLPSQPQQASCEVKNKTVELSWEHGTNNDYFVVYKTKKRKGFTTANVEDIIYIGGKLGLKAKLSRKNKPRKYNYFVTGISRTNHESNFSVCE